MKPIRTLSIIIPAYNEAQTITSLLDAVLAVDLIHGIEKEIIVVDDASTDSTGALVQAYIREHPHVPIRYFLQPENRGKGAALHKGIREAMGEYLIIQDADLEYDPQDYNDMLHPVVKGFADVVYGSRFKGSKPHRLLFFWHTIGNKFLTFLSNIFTDLNMTDMETCYKLFDTEMIRGLSLREKRFGFEPEVTNKIAKIPGVRIYEVGIAYYGRTYAEGKKIGWKDGMRAIYVIFKYGLFGRWLK